MLRHLCLTCLTVLYYLYRSFQTSLRFYAAWHVFVEDFGNWVREVHRTVGWLTNVELDC